MHQKLVLVSQRKLDSILDRNVKWVGVILYRFLKGKESTFQICICPSSISHNNFTEKYNRKILFGSFFKGRTRQVMQQKKVGHVCGRFQPKQYPKKMKNSIYEQLHIYVSSPIKAKIKRFMKFLLCTSLLKLFLE